MTDNSGLVYRKTDAPSGVVKARPGFRQVSVTWPDDLFAEIAAAALREEVSFSEMARRLCRAALQAGAQDDR